MCCNISYENIAVACVLATCHSKSVSFHCVFNWHVTKTIATAICSNTMCTECMPQQHFQIRCAPYQCQSNMFKFDVTRITATATFSTSMCTECIPQQYVLSRYATDICHSNIYQVNVYRINDTATCSNTMCPISMPQQHVPSLCVRN